MLEALEAAARALGVTHLVLETGERQHEAVTPTSGPASRASNASATSPPSLLHGQIPGTLAGGWALLDARKYASPAMSAPETPAAAREKAAPSVRPPGQARALNLVSVGAIACSARPGRRAGSRVPAWIKTSPTVVSVNDMPAPPNLRADGLPPLPQHPSFVTGEEDDGPDLEGLPGEPRRRSRSNDRSLPPDLPPGLPGGPETMVEPLHQGEKHPQVVQVDRGMTGRYGTTRRAAPLLAEPGDAAHILGQVRANERVVIVKEQGEWAFVFHGGVESGGSEMGTGWLKKSEIAIR